MAWNKKKTWKTVIIIFFSIVIIGLGINWYILSRLDKIVADQLESNISQLSNGLYHVKMDRMKVHFFSGYLSASGLTLYTDSTRLKYLKSKDSIPQNYANIHIGSIEFKGINFRKKSNLNGRHLIFSEIAINSPHINLTHNEEGIVSVKDTTKKSKTLYETISPIFDEIKVKKIKINNGRIDFQMESETDTSIVVMENIQFQADGFSIDSTSQIKNKVLYCDDFYFTIENSHHTFPGNLYSFSVGKISLGIKDSSLVVENAKLIPAYPKNEFAYKDTKHSDWMDLAINKMAFRGIHFHELIINKSVNIDSIQVNNVEFANFKNQKIIIEHRKMPLLHEVFQRIKTPITISNLKVDNMNVVYEELAKTGTKPGLIKFTDIHGEIQNLTNQPTNHTQVNTLIAKAKLMGEGQINATLKFAVDSTYDHFEIIGTLGPMNLLSLNKIIEPLAPAKINEGFVKGMDYHIIGGRAKAWINMQLLYNDLSITIQKENDKHQRSDMQLASLLANGLIKKDNPDNGEDKEPRRVQSEWVRDPYHSSFNYLWKIYFSGLVETLGYTDKRKSQVSWIKNALEKIKGDQHNKENKKKK